MAEPSFLKKQIQSFRYAFRGICFFFREQRNARIHIVAAVAAVALGLWVGISVTDWCIIAVCIGSVFAMEMLNTAVEYLADVVSPEKHPKIGKLKDIAAGAVLVVSFAALFCGVFILLIPLFQKIG